MARTSWLEFESLPTGSSSSSSRRPPDKSAPKAKCTENNYIYFRTMAGKELGFTFHVKSGKLSADSELGSMAARPDTFVRHCSRCSSCEGQASNFTHLFAQKKKQQLNTCGNVKCIWFFFFLPRSAKLQASERIATATDEIATAVLRSVIPRELDTKDRKAQNELRSQSRSPRPGAQPTAHRLRNRNNASKLLQSVSSKVHQTYCRFFINRLTLNYANLFLFY